MSNYEALKAAAKNVLYNPATDDQCLKLAEVADAKGVDIAKAVTASGDDRPMLTNEGAAKILKSLGA